MTTATTDNLIRRLQGILPEANVLHTQRDRLLYEYDASLERHPPDAIAIVETTEQVAEVVKLCAAERVPFTPRGSGTNLSGGSVPLHGGVLIGLSRMDQIIDLDPAGFRAVVQPGVLNMDLQDALAAIEPGYLYAPDPASQNVCTLGGNVAENAGGPRCFKYGVTTNHVLGLEVVLPSGEVTRFGGAAPDAPGYDLTGLFVGSEGTCGIATEIVCRVMRVPETTLTSLAVFDSLIEAGQAVSDVIAAGIIPATLEMMDKFLIRAVEEALHAGYPLDAEAVLIVEVDGLREGLQPEMDRIIELCNRNGCREIKYAEDPAERELLWRGRRGAFGAVARLAPTKLTVDVTVPRTELPRMLGLVREVGERHSLEIGNVFHAGDGNLHPQILFDDRDEELVRRVKGAAADIARHALELGGVLSGEHGIGYEKRDYMPLMFGPQELAALQWVKDAFDPEALCNPGKLLPDVATEPVELSLPAPGGDFLAGCREIVGPEQVVAPDDAAERSAQVSPRSYEQVAACLAYARQERQQVVLFGRGTKMTQLPPASAATGVTLSDLDELLDLDHDNLVATVQGGARLSAIQAALAEQGQWLPLDPPFVEQGATIGGVLAANASGPRRLLYGPPRDLVLGLRVALTDGAVIRCGGITVKNVAGYDLCKLMIGSRGTLGAICEATFRVLPRAEARRTILYGFRNQTAAFDAADAVLRSPLYPAAVEVLTPYCRDLLTWHADLLPHATESCVVVAIALEGSARTVARQEADLPALMGSAAEMLRLEADLAAAVWREVTDLPAGAWAEDTAAVRIGVPPSKTMEAWTRLLRLGAEAPLDCAIRACPGTGALVAVFSGEQFSDEWATRAWGALTDEVASLGGHATPAEPEGWPGAEPPAVASGTHNVTSRIKRLFDPTGVLPAI